MRTRSISSPAASVVEQGLLLPGSSSDPGGDGVRAPAHAFVRWGDRVGQLRAARPRRAGRARGPGELLDPDVHQLAAHGAVRAGVVAGLPGRRVGRDRRPHAGVLLRARDRPRAHGDERAGDRLPGRARQRLRGVDGVRQPLLAGALLRRRGRPHPRPPLRRRALRAVGARHPEAAGGRPRPRLFGGRGRGRGGGRLGPPAHTGDVPGLRARRALRVAGRRRDRRTPRL